jgi:hypothetical protein
MERSGGAAEPRQAFGRLSGRERAVVGSPRDYDWDHATTLPARTRPESVQFSIRVERDLLEGLQEIARREETTFSDIVRFALRNFVEKGGATSGLSNVVVTFGRVPMLIQVRGQQAEVPANRRTPLVDERIPPDPMETPITTAST